jgi:SAM-dependent methyltransferase
MIDTQIRNQIRERFAQIAWSPETERVFPVGPASAKNLGYDTGEIDALPVEATESFSGVGNPLALGELAAGQTVLDLGCGAGLDSILAARRVGPTGKVIAVDMTGAMLDKAQRNAATVGISNIEWHLADAENLPVTDGTVDVVITNGVLNLCQDKPKILAELHRVLCPGGRLQLADILLHENVTAQNVAKLGTWSD